MTEPTQSLLNLERMFRQGEITKPAYIEQSYLVHDTLFSYPAFLRNKNVESITITKDGVTVTTSTGVTLECVAGDVRSIPIEIMNLGDYEPAETRILSSLVDEDSVVIDIGANAGWYSIVLGRRASRGRVLAFEPIPQTRAVMKRNLELNGVSNVTLFEHGLGETEEELVFHFHPQHSGATSSRNLIAGEDVEVRARVRRMDDVLAIEKKIDLIKCDVEGAELFVLRGGVETLRRTKPGLFVEMLRKWSAAFGYHPNDILALLGRLGYQCFAVEGGALRPFDRMEETTVATNFLFLHPERHQPRIAELTAVQSIF